MLDHLDQVGLVEQVAHHEDGVHVRARGGEDLEVGVAGLAARVGGHLLERQAVPGRELAAVHRAGATPVAPVEEAPVAIEVTADTRPHDRVGEPARPSQRGRPRPPTRAGG